MKALTALFWLVTLAATVVFIGFVFYWSPVDMGGVAQ